MITPSFNLTASERVLPKLALDFTTASLDSRVTFTRTTGASNPATYVNSSGVVTAATNNQPRFDYDPVTLACKGLLIEEARTNLCLQSQALATSPWVPSSAGVASIPVVTNNYAISPDGTQNATRVQMTLNGGTTTSDYSILTQNITVTSAATYSASFYAKTNDGTTKTIQFRDGGSAAIFNVNKTITPQWQRFTVSGTAANTLCSFRFWLRGSQGTSNDCDISIYGAQLEAGAFATSYIPTTTAALTRNADVATMTGTDFSDWFNATEGTFVAQYIPKNPAPSNACGLFIADDGTGNNLVGVSVTSSLRGILSLATGGSGAGALAANSGTVNQVNKVAGSFKVNDYAVALNGGTVATSTALALPTVTQARIGFLARTGLYANAHIQKLAFYPVRGINAQVQAQSK